MKLLDVLVEIPIDWFDRWRSVIHKILLNHRKRLDDHETRLSRLEAIQFRYTTDEPFPDNTLRITENEYGS